VDAAVRKIDAATTLRDFGARLCTLKADSRVFVGATSEPDSAHAS